MDVTIPQAPPVYDEFRLRLRAFIASNAPARAEVIKAGLRTPETSAEVADLQRWLLALTEAGFNPLVLAEQDDPWPSQVAVDELESAGAPYKIGNPLVEAAIASHGTDEQKQRFLPRLRSGQDVWCQLFSEPNAGSDLAGMQTRAERDGDIYRVNGQKVWTTWGQWSDYGYLLARTNPAAEKHAGITAFVLDMRQPGVQVRPLREITGTSDFNEVFFTDALVSASDVIGGEGQGWRIATTSLASERSGQGGLDRALTGQLLDIVRLASATQDEGADADAAGLSQDLVRLYERAHALQYLEHRMASKHAQGKSGPADAALLKLTFSSLNLAVAEYALAQLGTNSILTEDDPRSAQRGRWQDMFLYARAYTISAGSNEIMRNVISERGLGMPREH